MRQKINHWSKIKEQGSGAWRLHFTLKIYQICGKKTARLLLYPIVFFIFIFSGIARKSSLNYLKKIHQFKLAQGDDSFSKPNYFSVFKHLFHFANSLLDRVESWSGKINDKKLNVKTPEILQEVFLELEKKQGPFFICSHLGNVEALRALANIQAGKKLAVNAIVQTSHTPDFNNLLKKINPDFSLNLISATDLGIDNVIIIKEKLQKGEIVVAAGDRTASGNEKKSLAVNFLGEKADFPLGSFTLASLMESKIYFVFFMKSATQDAYDFYLFKAKTDFISRANRKENLGKIIAEYASCLEEICLKYPYQWYNFFDFWNG